MPAAAVLYVHGLWMTGIESIWLRRRLARQRGYRLQVFRYASVRAPLGEIIAALRDTIAEKHSLIRIVDESGEDYLYPKPFFRSIALSQAVRRAVLAS